MENELLLSKIIPPNPSHYYLRRVHLMKRLRKIYDSKLTVLCSGAGYGKSSALAQFFADEQVTFSWYQVTETDDGVLPFLRHFYYSVKRVVPSFQLSDAKWDQIGRFPNTEQLNKLYTLFVNAFCAINEPLYVVIDDYHLVSHDFQIHYILDKLFEFLPSHIHVIIATRTNPTWNVMRQLKHSGQLVVCDESDFIFSMEEIQVFFVDYFSIDLNEVQLQRVYDLTEGWAIAVFLMAMQGDASFTSFEELTKLSMQDFFDYLSDEIFSQCESNVQQSLMNYAIFPHFSYELIAAIFGQQECENLRVIMANHTFIQPLATNKAFKYHSLFHQFLQQKWLEINVEQYKALHKKSAWYFLQNGQITEAFYHVMRTKDEPFITEQLISNAHYFLRLGHYEWLLEQVKLLSAQTRQTVYQLYFIEGECQRFRAFYEKAKQAYEECMHRAKIANDALYVLKATAGMANIYLDTLQPSLAKTYLVDALALAKKVDLQEDEMLLLHRQYAENLVNLGFAYEAEKHIEQQQLPQHILVLGNIDIRILLRQGKLHEARILAEQRMQEEHPFNDAHRETGALLSLIYAMMGEAHLAHYAAFQGLQNSQLVNAQFASAVANLRAGHASILLYPNNLQLAVSEYEQAVDWMDKMHVARIKAECYMGMCIAKSRLGLLEEGVQDAEKGLQETERVKDQWVSGLLFVALTINYYENHLYDEAQRMAVRAMHSFENCRDEFCMMVAHFWQLVIAMEGKNDSAFNEHFNIFSEMLEQNNYYFFVEKPSLFGPRSQNLIYVVCQYAFRMPKLWQQTTKIAQKIAFQEQLIYPKEPLFVQLLGPMFIVRDGEKLLDKVWQREKAKDLFVYLYMRRHYYISKEELLESLWPYSNEDAQNRDFKIAYNTMLKVLEPNRTARADTFYIIRKNNLYKLQQEPFVESDVEQFERAVRYAQAQHDENYQIYCLKQLPILYHGAFFQERQLVHWVDQERDRLRMDYVEGLQQIATFYMEKQDYKECVVWSKKIIEIDATWEEAYRLLMISYYAMQNRVAAIKWYERCTEQLKNELNIEPMDITTELYESIVK